MKMPVHDTVARFRVNNDLMARVSAKARRDGMTVSELIREAMRREVGTR